jgi:alpha-mannosidase
VVEDGAVRTVVEAVFAYGNSAICQRYLLPKVGAEIEVQTRVHWEEKNRLLKLSIPTPSAADSRYIGQTAFGIADLPTNGDEGVAQKWVAAVANDNSSALTCINNGTYGSDFSEDGLRLTLLRSPAYSGHPIGDTPIVPQNRYTPRIDQGERLYKFWLCGGPAEQRLEVIDREALVKNETPVTLSFFPSGAGILPQPLITLSDTAVQVTAAKLAYESDDLIVRLFEPTGAQRTTTMSLPFFNITQEVTLSPFEVKTLRINPTTKTISETDLLER